MGPLDGALFLVDAFDGVEGCVRDALGSVYHTLQMLAFLCIGIVVPGLDAASQSGYFLQYIC